MRGWDARVCGIAGVVRADGQEVERELIAAMVGTLHHRGPDGEGSYFAPGIGLGHTRLAIIDLSSASNQPFLDRRAGLAMVFNGEIYNYLELREQLQSLGHRFESTGDTEVLLRAYEEWGAGCLPRLNGMFAFAIWNDRNRELFFARDRFGEKPLYLATTRHGLAFASEMKAILAISPDLREPNPRSIYRYLSRGDLNLDHESFFPGIESLPPGHSLIVRDGGAGQPVRYWLPPAVEAPAAPGAAIERFRELFFDSVRIRLRSDVPVGSSLSGGLDSSSVVAAIDAQKGLRDLTQRTFSARFRSRRHDEGHYIRVVTEHVNAEPYEVWVDPDRFDEDFALLQWHQEEPVASVSPYAQWCVMRLARERDTVVLLDGQGADEMLAGYDQAHGMFWAHWLRRWRYDRLGQEMLAYARRYRDLRQPALFTTYYLLPKRFRDPLTERYYRSADLVSPALHRHAPAYAATEEPFPDRLRNELVRWQMTTQLPEFLRYADRNSMAFSREVRLPFLDHRLIEFCFGLPPEMLLSGAVTKVVMRQAMQGIVPAEVLERKDKLAYAPPQQRWLRGPVRPWLESLLTAAAKRTEIFNPRTISDLRASEGTAGMNPLIWRVASTEAWFQAFIDRSTPAVPPAETVSPHA